MIKRFLHAFRSQYKAVGIVAAIVAVNFVLVVRMVGLSYSPYNWATFAGYDTPTSTATPIPDGGPCVDSMDCQSGNCVDDVCCNELCDGPNEICNLQGDVGTCTELAAPAPTVTRPALVLAVLILLLVGAVASRSLRRQRRI